MKTSPTLYVSKVLIRHDRTPNVKGSNNRIRDNTQNQQQNIKRCTDITRTFPHSRSLVQLLYVYSKITL